MKKAVGMKKAMRLIRVSLQEWRVKIRSVKILIIFPCSHQQLRQPPTHLITLKKMFTLLKVHLGLREGVLEARPLAMFLAWLMHLMSCQAR